MATLPSSPPAPNAGMRTFYILAATQVISILGSRMSGFAIAIWVTQQTGNATPLAMVAFFSLVPMILLSNVAGLLADRWDRRYVMAISDAGQAFGTILLLLSFASGDFQLWHLYAVSLLQGAFGIFQMPAAQASITMLVPDDKRERANAITQVIGPAAGLVAPALAGALYGVIGVMGLIVLDFATFVLSVIVLLLVHIPRPAPQPKQVDAPESMWTSLAAGFHFLWGRRALFSTMLFASVVNVILGSAAVLYVPYVLARTGSEAHVGIVPSMEGLGAIAGAILIGIWGGTRPRIHIVMIGLIVAASAFALFGLSTNVLSLSLTTLAALMPITVVNAAFMSLTQAKVPADLQGRVFALMNQLSMLLSPLGYLVIGPLADQVFEPAVGGTGWAAVAPLVGSAKGAGIGLLIFLAGALVAVASLVYYAIPAVRRMEAPIPDAVVQPTPAPAGATPVLPRSETATV